MHNCFFMELEKEKKNGQYIEDSFYDFSKQNSKTRRFFKKTYSY